LNFEFNNPKDNKFFVATPHSFFVTSHSFFVTPSL
jgi:hypothetical protein